MVSSKHFLYIMLWDHPIETTIYKQMAIRFQVFPPKSTFAYIDLYTENTHAHSNFDLAQPPNMRWSFKQDWDRLLSGCFILTQLCFSDHEIFDSEVLPKMTWRKSSKNEDFLGGVFKTCVPVWSLPFPLVQRNMTLQTGNRSWNKTIFQLQWIFQGRVSGEPRKKTGPYFPLNPGCLLRILIMVYCVIPIYLCSIILYGPVFIAQVVIWGYPLADMNPLESWLVKMTYGTPLFFWAEIIPIFHWLGFVIPPPPQQKTNQGPFDHSFGENKYTHNIRCVCPPTAAAGWKATTPGTWLKMEGKGRNMHYYHKIHTLHIPRELTYATWQKGKSSSNVPFWGDMLVPREGIFIISVQTLQVIFFRQTFRPSANQR